MTAASGMIKDMAVPWLFQDLLAGKKTGTGIFGFGAAVKKVYFSEGKIVFAASNREEDRLGECMIRIGAITHEQRDRSLEEALATGKKLGAVLIEKGFITSRQLVAGVSHQIKHITTSVFKGYGGCYIFDEGPLPDIISISIGTVSLILEGIGAVEWEMIRRTFPAVKTTPGKTGKKPLLVDQTKLDPDQQTVFALVDGKKSIADICTSSGLGDYNALKALYVLCAIRIVE
jgi:hypothetical protein